jgi:hypothetical protein
MASTETLQDLEHFYRFGDVYDALEACDQLEFKLARLRRQSLLPADDCQESREDLSHIRGRLENYISSSSLLPKGPRLP